MQLWYSWRSADWLSPFSVLARREIDMKTLIAEVETQGEIRRQPYPQKQLLKITQQPTNISLFFHQIQIQHTLFLISPCLWKSTSLCWRVVWFSHFFSPAFWPPGQNHTKNPHTKLSPTLEIVATASVPPRSTPNSNHILLNTSDTGGLNLSEIQRVVVEIQRNLYLQNLETQKLPGNCSQENQTALPPLTPPP